MIGLNKLFKWIKEEENSFFAIHIAGVFILSFIINLVSPLMDYKTFFYPLVLLGTAASFMINYPIKAIKNHGIFSQYMIELRLLWLVILGIISEYLALGFTEKRLNIPFAIAGLGVGILLVFYSRTMLEEKLVKERGFK